MELTSNHKILVKGENDKEACELVERFFQRTTLINYDNLEIINEKIINGADPLFFPALDQGVEENLQLMRESIQTLEKGGCHSLADVLSLTNPYLCKVFHITAHLVDGFIDIDSKFYNIIEDSHRVSDYLRREILTAPYSYWLLGVRGYFGARHDVSPLR